MYFIFPPFRTSGKMKNSNSTTNGWHGWANLKGATLGLDYVILEEACVSQLRVLPGARVLAVFRIFGFCHQGDSRSMLMTPRELEFVYNS